MADRNALLRRLVHADLSALRSKSTGKMISQAIQKSVLFVVAMHEGEQITIAQIAALAGLSQSATTDALNAIQDQRLLERVHASDGTLPASRKTAMRFGYRINWRAVVATDMVDVEPARISGWAKRRAVRA